MTAADWLFVYAHSHRKALEDFFVMAGGTRFDAERTSSRDLKRIVDGEEPMPVPYSTRRHRIGDPWEPT